MAILYKCKRPSYDDNRINHIITDMSSENPIRKIPARELQTPTSKRRKTWQGEVPKSYLQRT